MKNIYEKEEKEKSVDEDDYSETNLYYASQKMNFKSSQTKTMYFEFDIRNAKDLSMNSENAEEMHDLTLLNI